MVTTFSGRQFDKRTVSINGLRREFGLATVLSVSPGEVEVDGAVVREAIGPLVEIQQRLGRDFDASIFNAKVTMFVGEVPSRFASVNTSSVDRQLNRSLQAARLAGFDPSQLGFEVDGDRVISRIQQNIPEGMGLTRSLSLTEQAGAQSFQPGNEPSVIQGIEIGGGVVAQATGFFDRFDITHTYTPPVIPNVGDVEDTLNDITIPITIAAGLGADPPDEISEFRGILSQWPSVTYNVPLISFVELKDLDEFSCGELLQGTDIRGEIDSFTNNFGSPIRAMRRDVTEIQDISSDLLSAVGTTPPTRLQAPTGFNTGGNGLISRLENLTPEQVGQQLSSSQIREFQSRVSNTNLNRANIQEAISTGEDLLSRVRSAVPERCRPDLLSKIQDILEAARALQDKLPTARELRQRLSELLSVEFDPCSNISEFNEASRDITELENDLPNEVRSEVRDANVVGDLPNVIAVATVTVDGETFTVRAQSPQASAAAARRIQSRLRALSSRASQLESDIGRLDIEQRCKDQIEAAINIINAGLSRARPQGVEVEGLQLGCGDVSRGLRSRVNSFQNNADEFLDLPRSQRTESRRKRLVGQGEALRTEINREVSGNNPCKSELRAVVGSRLGDLRGASTRLPSQVPCSEKFPSLEADIDVYVQRTSTLNLPASPQEVQTLSGRGEELINRIQENVEPDDPCREQFADRIRNALDRLETARASVRIVEAPEGFQREQQQQLQDLRQSIQLILQQPQFQFGQ